MFDLYSVDYCQYSGYILSVEVACLVGYLRFVGSIPRSASNMLPCIIVHVYIYVNAN